MKQIKGKNAIGGYVNIARTEDKSIKKIMCSYKDK